MRWLLRIAGRTRARFTRLPHWAGDLYSLLSYVNFVELVPTLAAIAISPRHFFRRLPQTLRGARPLFQTPVKFFFNFAALFLILFFVRHGDLSNVVSQSQAFWYLPAIIPLTPLAMIALGMLSLVLYQIPRLTPNGDAFPAPNSGAFRLLLNPATYARLDPAKFFWGLFYISCYFVAVWQVVQVLIVLDFLGVVYLVGALGEGHEVPKLIAVVLGIGLAAIAIHGLVLYPYMEMLRASLRRPTRAVYEGDVHEIKQNVKEFLKFPANADTLDAQATALYEVITDDLRRLNQTIAQQNLDFDLTSEDIEIRLQVHRSALCDDSLRDHLRNVSVPIREKFEVLLSQFDSAPSNDRRMAA